MFLFVICLSKGFFSESMNVNIDISVSYCDSNITSSDRWKWQGIKGRTPLLWELAHHLIWLAPLCDELQFSVDGRHRLISCETFQELLGIQFMCPCPLWNKCPFLNNYIFPSNLSLIFFSVFFVCYFLRVIF